MQKIVKSEGYSPINPVFKQLKPCSKTLEMPLVLA